jgi:hypothetical protein
MSNIVKISNINEFKVLFYASLISFFNEDDIIEIKYSHYLY